MNLMIRLTRFLCICNYFCFAAIVVETNCTLCIVEDKLYAFHGTGHVCLFSVRVCTSPVQFSVQRLQHRVMISCSIHRVDELYSGKTSLRNSSFFVEYAYSLRIARISPNLQI